jgi:hypothetical protein
MILYIYTDTVFFQRKLEFISNICPEGGVLPRDCVGISAFARVARSCRDGKGPYRKN